MYPLKPRSRLKVSRYLVVSDRAYADDVGPLHYRLVLSTRSGALLFLSVPLVNDLLAGRLPTEAATVEQLREAEILVPTSRASEFDTLRSRNARAIANQSTSTFTIVPTAFCNMSCSYCGQSHAKARLTPSLIDVLEKRVLAAAAQPTCRRIHISWFGGEPMSALDIIESLSSRLILQIRVMDVDYSASIITNGVLLSVASAERLASSSLVTTFTITLDGPQRAHDLSRPLKNGRSSHATILATLSQLAAQESLRHVQFVIRTNVSRLNCEALPGFFADCAQKGLNVENMSFELSPVYSWSNDVSEIELDRQAYAQIESDLLCEMSLHGLRSAVIPTNPHAITCVAVDPRAEVIGPDGSLFSCTEQVLVPSLAHERLGTASGTAPRPAGRYNGFNERDVAGLPCADCVMFGICGGACPKHWKEGIAPCPSYKFNIQDRLDLGAIQAGMRIA